MANVKFDEMQHLYQECLKSLGMYVEKATAADKQCRSALEETRFYKAKLKDVETLCHETTESADFLKEKVCHIE